VLEKEGIPIQLRYSYHSFPQTEPDSLSLFSALESDNSDGLILFPVGGQACRVFFGNSLHSYRDLQRYPRLHDAGLVPRPCPHRLHWSRWLR
jgi:hypothetical protein